MTDVIRPWFFNLIILSIFLASCTSPPRIEATVAGIRDSNTATTTPIPPTASPQTPSPTASLRPSTPTSTLTTTPTPTFTVSPRPLTPRDLDATRTAIPLTSTAIEWATLNAPTPTPPILQDPPLSTAPWTLLFRGFHCYIGDNDCDPHEEMGIMYLINTDGSGFRPYENSNLPEGIVWSTLRASPDGQRITYAADVPDDNGTRSLFLANADGSNPVNLGISFAQPYNVHFLPEPDCLLIHEFLLEESPEVAIVTFTKVCSNQPPVLIDTITFADLKPPARIRVSPDGRQVAAYSVAQEGGNSIYMATLNDPSPPRFVFHANESFFPGPFTWLSNNQTLEFIVQSADLNGNTGTTQFYRALLNDEDVEMYLELSGFTIRDAVWSPNGKELAFIYHVPDIKPIDSGLYIMDLETGEWQKILWTYYISPMAHWTVADN